MIHHVSVGSDDIDRARAFYNPVLQVIGLRPLTDDGRSVDYGSGAVEFSVETPSDGRRANAGNGVHIAFAAESRAMVDAFHAAALAYGGSDAGRPGVREEYDANYYGAFVLDPDGNKIEAVTFSSE